MKFENTYVCNMVNALRGMRNPKNSWARSDSKISQSLAFSGQQYMDIPVVIGKNDMRLAQTLIKGGSEHRKFLRQIFVSVDITAPLYWWKEADTYKVGTTANSCSTMHKLAETPITLGCFERDDYQNVDIDYGPLVNSCPPVCLYDTDDFWNDVVRHCEKLRKLYLETKGIHYWKELIRILPESWLQKRTFSANYEIIRTIVRQRQNHKLSEWKQFVDWARTLPYAKEFIFFENSEDMVTISKENFNVLLKKSRDFDAINEVYGNKLLINQTKRKEDEESSNSIQCESSQ